MTDFPDVKLKTLVSFPATVAGGTGIDVTRASGVYTFDLDHGELTAVSTVASLATSYVVLWDQTANSYSRISLTDLKTLMNA